VTTGDSPLALDWLNGRRTPDANPLLKGAVAGLTLGTDAPQFFRSLVEATAYGSRAIVDRFIAEDVHIGDVIAVGGVADRSPLVMQILADVLDMPIKVSDVEQTCALGAAMHAAVVGGLYATVEDAQDAMGGSFSRTFEPEENAVAHYRSEYRRYQAMAENSESQAAT
jgi:L-ribulokinase